MTKQGNFQLILNGFEYNKRTQTNGTTFWRCAKQYRHGCKGKAQTRQIGSKQMTKVYGKHNHHPNVENQTK